MFDYSCLHLSDTYPFPLTYPRQPLSCIILDNTCESLIGSQAKLSKRHFSSQSARAAVPVHVYDRCASAVAEKFRDSYRKYAPVPSPMFSML
ncbi:hypothetical protein Y032_0052g2223 [Ancylostoma ceylanicum]|uniref:Uncharacterized protein n=1 Tax=Ancylostoma ceylanicum TaxID=53326 RepID=A0A016U870_9BILA|nr:hypothetical protein Y032_0052g2223 [Ancylostoma ceylanicum]